ncbi:DNA-directed RNA polymerase II subunit RPB1-like, partial [Tigriopus californicus]|uniref:DNA-directed RNA polymerase II subunit RPB1-like n=1 Tax=Tigriopus californicus TaxID=6832 RepID=UPI0027DAA5EF
MKIHLKCVRTQVLILVILFIVNPNSAFDNEIEQSEGSPSKSKARRRIYDRFEFSEDFASEPKFDDHSISFEDQQQPDEANFPALNPFQSDHLMPFRIPQFKDQDQYLKLDDVRSDGGHQAGHPRPPTFGFDDYYEAEPDQPEQSFNYFSKLEENTLSRPKIKVQYNDNIYDHKPLDPVKNVGYSEFVTTKPIDTSTKGNYYKKRIVKKAPKYSKILDGVKTVDSNYQPPKPSSDQYGEIKPSKPSYEKEEPQVYYKPVETKSTTYKPVVYYKPLATTTTLNQYSEPSRPSKPDVYYKPLPPTQKYEKPISTGYDQPTLVETSSQNNYQAPHLDPILNEVDYTPPKVLGTNGSKKPISTYQSLNISKYSEEPMPMVYYKPLAVVPTEPGFTEDYPKPLAVVPTVKPQRKKRKRTRKTKPRYNQTQNKPCDQAKDKNVPKAKPSYQPNAVANSPSKEPTSPGLFGIFSLFSNNQDKSAPGVAYGSPSKPTYHSEMKPPGPRNPGKYNSNSEIQSGYGEVASMPAKLPSFVGSLLTCLPISIAAALVPFGLLNFNPTTVTVTPSPVTMTVT